MNRRDFLAAALAGAALPAFRINRALASPTARLSIGTRTIDVNGRAVSVYALLGPDGRPGLALDAGSDFAVDLVNGLAEETAIHWHGLTPPWQADGVPGAPTPLMAAGETRSYRFPAGPGGTHWMHAHTLQEQNLLAAPLIVRTAEDRAADEQEVVVLLHDFSFTPAADLLVGLRAGSQHAGSDTGGAAPMAGMDSSEMASMDGMDHGPVVMDLNDIAYDAYLANDRTLDDPEVVPVERGGRVRLRIINGATSTGFTIDLGQLQAELIAVDGQGVVPLQVSRVPLSMGQRADIRLTVPKGGGAFPILALREGAAERTGIVLATTGATIARLPTAGETAGPVLDLAVETRLRAVAPLGERRADHAYTVHLVGDMATYGWGMMGTEGLRVRRGERVEIALMNMSMMAHPMHLHGHRFQVVAIDGEPVAGAVRDTVLVPPMRQVTIAVEADNPGRWAFHCHHLYHMAAGMMAEFAYEGVA